MSASLQLPGGLLTLNPQPEISRYYNTGGSPYASTAEVLGAIVPAARYIGQTFLVGTTEYWFNPTTLDIDLVKKVELTNILTQTITDGDIIHAPSGDAVYDALLLKGDKSVLDAHIANVSNPHATTAIQVPATPHIDYLTGANVQAQLDQTETSIVASVKIDKTDFKNLYQTGRVRIDTDTSVLSISPANTLNITAVDNILFINEIVIDTPANKISDFLLNFGTRVFVANGTNTPLAVNTRGVFYVGINKLGNAVYQVAKIYDQDICYLARIVVENLAGVYSIVLSKYYPDLANNRPTTRDRLVASSGSIVPSGAASISFGNRGVTFTKNSVNYSINKFDPNYLALADTVNPTPMQFLFALPNLTSLATSIALSTVINPLQWYNAAGTIGGGNVANANYQVYRLLVTVTGTLVIQTKASTSNAPAFNVNAIFANRDDALAGLTSVQFPEILPAGDAKELGTFYLRAGTAVNGSQISDPNDFYFRPAGATASSSTTGVTVHDALSGKNDNPAFQHVTTADITNWNQKANDANVVHKTGNENITGIKTINSDNGAGAIQLIHNTGNIAPLTMSISPSVLNGAAILIDSGAGAAAKMILLNSATSTTSDLIYHNKNNVLNFKVDNSGNVLATSLAKIGGTAFEYLMANGSVSTLANPITGTGVSGQVSFFTGATTQAGDAGFIWDNTNKRLGIGIANPATALHSIGTITVRETATQSAGINIINRNATRSWILSSDATAVDDGKFAIIDATSSNARMVIDTNGNVGIGTATTSQKLNVNGNIFIDANNSTVEFGNGTNVRYGSIGFDNDLNFVEIKQKYPTSGGIKFFTGTTDLRMTILNNGNVTVKGGEATPTIGGNGMHFTFNGTTAGIFALDPGIAWRDLKIAAKDTIFLNNSGLETVRFQSGGNVLIGTATDGSAKTFISSANNQIGLRVDNSFSGYTNNLIYGIIQATTASSSFNLLKLDVGGGLTKFNVDGLGNVTATGSITATAFFTSSDIRLKDVVTPIHKDPTDLKSISYTWKDKEKDQKVQIGYSAQDVQQYIPEAVSEDEEGNLTVNYTQILIAKIEVLENRIKQLENR